MFFSWIQDFTVYEHKVLKTILVDHASRENYNAGLRLYSFQQSSYSLLVGHPRCPAFSSQFKYILKSVQCAIFGCSFLCNNANQLWQNNKYISSE